MFLEPEKLFENSDFYGALKLRHEIGHQTIFLITGNTNAGKTVFATIFYYLLEKGLFKREINLNENQMYFSVMDFAKHISELYDRQILYDEAGAELDIAEWNGIFNKIMKYILQTQRTHKNTFFILLPHIRYISQTLLPLFNFHIVIDLKIHKDENGKITKERIANVYKIVPQQIYSEYHTYQSIILVASLKIPNVDEIENEDFKELYKKFKEIEETKKRAIAHGIEEMVFDYEKKEELNKLKLKRAHKHETLKLEKIAYEEQRLKEKKEKRKEKAKPKK